MKTKTLTSFLIAFVAMFNLTTSAIIITNGYRTVKAKPQCFPNETALSFINTSIYRL